MPYINITLDEISTSAPFRHDVPAEEETVLRQWI